MSKRFTAGRGEWLRRRTEDVLRGHVDLPGGGAMPGMSLPAVVSFRNSMKIEEGLSVLTIKELLGEVSAYDRELERQNAELRESEERLRQIAENIREVFWMSSPDKSDILYISPGYEEIWGRSCDELRARPKSWLETIHPEDRPRVLQAAMTQQTTGDYVQEYRILRPDGGMRWIRDRAFPIRDTNGEIYRVAGLAEDVTEQKAAEAELRAARSGLEAEVVRRTIELQIANERLKQEIEQRRWMETAIREVQEATRGSTGQDFLQSLVMHLAKSLQADFAVVSRLIAGDRARTVAVWADGAGQPDFDYALADTPCQSVMTERRCWLPSGVAARFPGNLRLRKWGVESYLGTPLFGANGAPLGLLCVMSRRPMAGNAFMDAVLDIFASQAAAELSRLP